MSTNYKILLQSEKELKKIISEYLEFVYKIHSKLWNELNEEDYHKAYDNSERRFKQALIMEDELIDECVWTISKDDPRANHLRFIISVIYCAKDLTRAAEYAQSIAKIIIRKNIEQKYVKALDPIVTLYLNVIQKIIKIYLSTTEDKIEKVDQLYLEFEVMLENNEKKMREKFDEQSKITYLYISQITRLINSTIERVKSVFPSTMFVKSLSPSTKKKD